VLDLLGALVDQSLVVVERDGGEPRYRLLSPVRGYAIERLDECEGADVIRHRHAAFFTALAVPEDRGGDPLRWLELLESEHDNLTRALVWQLAHAPGEAARLAGRLWPYWYQRGYYAEARDWFERTLATSTSNTPTSATAAPKVPSADSSFGSSRTCPSSSALSITYSTSWFCRPVLRS
jgi:predicted ATPase